MLRGSRKNVAVSPSRVADATSDDDAGNGTGQFRVIRGISGTVAYNDLVPGAFYLRQSYGGEPRLIQVIRLAAPNEDESNRHFALIFEPAASPELYIEELEIHDAYALMQGLSVRVDPPSAAGHRMTTTIRAGNFFVLGTQPFVAAQAGRVGTMIINLSTGIAEQKSFQNEAWIIFSRWQLVADENGEEVPIASFGEDPALN